MTEEQRRIGRTTANGRAAVTHNGRGQMRVGRGAKLFVTALAAACLLAPAAARAKVGDGFKVGPGRLHLGLEVDGRYDSMAIVRPTGNDGDGIGLLRGNFALDVPGQNVKLNLSGGIDWNQFLSLTAPVNNSNAAFSFFGANVLGTATINPGGQVGLDLTENLSRSDHTANPLFSVGVLGLSNSTRARLWGRPGGGAIEIGGGYELGIDAYSPQVSSDFGTNTTGTCQNNDVACTPGTAAAFNSILHRVGVDAKWRLLPKTGLTFEANYGWKSYMYGSSVAGTVGASPVRALLGFGTLLSTRTTFAVRLGYGGIIFDSPAIATRHNVIAQVEGGYRLTETLSARIGYARGDEPIAGASLFYADDRIYADFKGQFNRVVAGAMASVDFIGYGVGTRSDTNVGLAGTLDYNFNDWMRLTSRAGFTTRTTNVVGGSYSRGEIALGVAALF